MAKLEFVALDLAGTNYLRWVLDAKMHLQASNLGETIVDDNVATSQDRAKAMIFIRRHLHEGLKEEYLTVENPLILWKALEDRYDHHRTITLPKARYDWSTLRLQDFKSISEYNSAMFKISSKLKLCGETITDADMLEKTFSTFHVSNILLQQQYRERGFTRYSDLISCLLLAEQNNELLLKNHQSRPTGSAPFPEVNVISNEAHATVTSGSTHKRRPKNRRGRWNKRGHNGTLGPRENSITNRKNAHNKNQMNNAPRKMDGNCHRCGDSGHWARTCRTPKHLVVLYQASLKDKNVEANFIDQADTGLDSSKSDTTPMDLDLDKSNTTHLEASDFFTENGGEAFESEYAAF